MALSDSTYHPTDEEISSSPGHVSSSNSAGNSCSKNSLSAVKSSSMNSLSAGRSSSKNSPSAGKSSSLQAQFSSNMPSSSEIEKLQKEALECVEEMTLKSGVILAYQERRRNEFVEVRNDSERLMDNYKGKVLMMEENSQTHRRQKEKWQNEKAELEKKVSVLEKKLIQEGEQSPNEEQQQLRKELIELFNANVSDKAVIGVKQLGELDCAAFKRAVNKHLIGNCSEDSLSQLCTTWQRCLQNPDWIPFKTVPLEGSDDQYKKIVDAEDQKLTMLKTVMGDDAYEVVVAALEERNEYSPDGGSCSVSELWNFKENRKATLVEGLAYLNDQGRCLKRGRK